MTVEDTLSRLRGMSNEKVFALNKKRGATDSSQFGLKLGDIRTLAKEIKNNHSLALELWKTRNIDARLLSVLIMSPKSLSVNELNEMAKSIDFPQVADWLGAYVVKVHPERLKLREIWVNSDNKWQSRLGWGLFIWITEMTRRLANKDFFQANRCKLVN